MSSQHTHVNDAFVAGVEAEIDLAVEPYEEQIAIHATDSGVDGANEPALSLYLSPVDAVIHAERILTAARSVVRAREEAGER